jgi:hypothetical protein
MNNHIVSESIIKGWKLPQHRPNGQKVAIYCANDSSIKYLLTDEMFSKENFLTSREEKFYSDMIETGVGKFRRTLHETRGLVSSPEVRRALGLYVYCQVERFMKYEGTYDPVHAMNALPDLNAYADLVISGSDFRVYGGAFFLPKIGLSLVPIGRFGKAFVVPLQPDLAIIQLDKSVPSPVVDVLVREKMLLAMSMGHNPAALNEGAGSRQPPV